MPALSQIKAAVDFMINDIITNQIAPKQAIYLANNGKYWQGILTSDISSLPNMQTGDASPTNVTPATSRKATDAVSWNELGIVLDPDIPMSIEVDAYSGPQGKGYVVKVFFKHTGVIQTKAINFGPETSRNKAWGVYTPHV